MNFKAKEYFEKRLNMAEKLLDIAEVDLLEDAKLELLDSIAYSLAIIADHLTGAEQECTCAREKELDAMHNEFDAMEDPDGQD